MLFLNNIALSPLGITPFIYVAAVMLIPFETPAWFRLFFAFLLGLLIDIFTDTGGMHAFSLVLIAYLRPAVLNLIAPRDGYELSDRPQITYLGLGWFLKYASLLLIIHLVTFFFLDALSFSLFFSSIVTLFFTFIFSIVVIILSQYLVYRN